MKKVLFMLVVLCVAVFALSACSFVGAPAAKQELNKVEKDDTFSSEANTTATNQASNPVEKDDTFSPEANTTVTNQTSNPVEPPNTLIFNGLQEYYDFAQSVNLGKDDFVSYIDGNNLLMNGIQTQDDVRDVLDMLNPLPIPFSETFHFIQMIIDLDKHTCFVLFNGDTNERCSFLIYIDGQDVFNPRDQTKITNEQTQLIPVDEATGIDNLYIVNDAKSNSQVSYYAAIDGYSVLIRTYEIQEESINSTLSTFEFQSDKFCIN